MLTCIIRYEIERYEIEPHAREDFEAYARVWNEAIPDCGADLIGYYAPHEGSATLAYGIYNIASLADYEIYRARLRADAQGQRNYAFAQERKFIRREDRVFLRKVV